jgi:hypothetical protein
MQYNTLLTLVMCYVISCTGAFKLDPNRVCELLLEAAERDEAGVGHWLGLMKLFNKKAPMEVRV